MWTKENEHRLIEQRKAWFQRHGLPSDTIIVDLAETGTTIYPPICLWNGSKLVGGTDLFIRIGSPLSLPFFWITPLLQQQTIESIEV
jgi:hypothetical protein